MVDHNAEFWLGELLACIHGDGGHYLGRHGLEKATKDAMDVYYNLLKDLDCATWERDKCMKKLTAKAGLS